METIELGGHIKLSGFSELDNGEMVIIKKIVGHYTRKFYDNLSDFKELVIDMDKHNSAISLTAKMLNDDKKTRVQLEGKNIFFTIDQALKKIESENF